MSFEKKGEKSQQTLVLEAFESAHPGDVVSYESLGATLNFAPDTQRSSIHAAVNLAKKKLLTSQSKAVVAVTNQGYRVIAANEHVTLAKTHQKKLNRQLSMAKRTVDSADFNQLTEAEKALALAAGAALGFQQEQIRKLDIRQTKLEQVLKAFVPAQVAVNESQDSRISALEQRLAELNKKFEQEA